MPNQTLGAELHLLRLARRLTVEINNKIYQTAYGAEPGAGTSGHYGFLPSVEHPCPSLSAERYVKLHIIIILNTTPFMLSSF